MSRIKKDFPLKDSKYFAQQLLEWAQKSSTYLWLDSNNYPQKYSSFNTALALDKLSELKTDYKGSFQKLKEYQQQNKDYIFGYLSYDLKNDIENLESKNNDNLAFADLYFFQPKKLFFIKDDTVVLRYDSSCAEEMVSDLKIIKATVLKKQYLSNKTSISQRISKKNYLLKIKKLKKHIRRGDTYETNFCMEYFTEKHHIDPLYTYNKLNEISKTPFACFFRNNSHFLMSASPERFARKEGQKIISQPIKGTIKRGRNTKEDTLLINQLQNDPKERSENIMIVDLVRNDLSKTATKDSVKVEELCQIYSFKQVHQMTSTVVSRVIKDQNPVDLIKSLFPMGSMTGAPKIATMKIIEQLEETKRGVYSGAVGYFTPKDDFDFNVVIRSILYNEKEKYVSFSVGGAITSKSIPENEYQECELKAAAMKEVLSN